MLIFLSFIIIAICFTYYLLIRNRNYWKIRNVPFVNPLPLFGNYKEYILLRKHINHIDQEICQQFQNEPYVGTFYGTTPALLIQDPNLLRLVMSKEFYYCNGRESSEYKNKELITNNMFFAYGDEWKVLRTNLTPLFSSAKLKNMFHLIQNSSDTLETLIDEEICTSSNIDVKSLLLRYTISCITACAFGITSDTMKKSVHKNPFTTVADQIFDVSEYAAIKGICRSMWPRIFYAFGFKVLTEEVGKFFNSVISEVLKSRSAAKSSRNDFVDLLLTWKKDNYITGDCFNNTITGDKNKVNIEVDDSLLISQCVLFFAAGFETTSTTTSFLLYELAKDKNAQDKIIEEVDEYFAKHQTIEYECITMMPYTEACLDESLRLYPVLGILNREVMNEYSLPTGLSFKKGDRIHIPVYHIQHNPDNFPEPEVFRPERFFGEEKKNIKPYTYMPFGEGPRACIGQRFAKMPIYAALLTIFKKYRVELGDNMSLKLRFDPKSLIIQPIGGIHLKLIPREP